MRTSVLLAAAVLALAPTAALAQGSEPAPPPPAAEDPCAPVDGEVPLMCQSGTVGGPAQLPLTGGTPYAEGALLLAAVGGGALLVARRRTA